MLFLADAALASGVVANSPLGSIIETIKTIITIAIWAVISISILAWIYMSLAFMAIGKKAKLSYPGLSWIPGFGPLITTFRISGMHWWPWLLFITLLIVKIAPVIGIVLSIVGMLVFAVYSFIWSWKMFEAVEKPGWWALMPLIPLFGILIYIVLIGIAAWSKKQ